MNDNILRLHHVRLLVFVYSLMQLDVSGLLFGQSFTVHPYPCAVTVIVVFINLLWSIAVKSHPLTIQLTLLVHLLSLVIMLRNKLFTYGDESVEVPAHMNFGKELLDRMVGYKDVTAMLNSDTGECISYRDLAQTVVNIALSLVRMGVRRGDIISVCSEKRFEVMATMIGIACAGATYSPTDITYGEIPLIHRVNIAKPSIIFCSLDAYKAHRREFDLAGCVKTFILYGEEKRDGAIKFSDFLTESAKVEDFIPRPVKGWEDNLFLIFSSGTSGLPKGVPLTHLNVLVNSRAFVDNKYIGWRVLSSREWYYTYGLMLSMWWIRGGCTIVYSQRNSLEDNLQAIQKYKVQTLQMTPSSAVEFVKYVDIDKYDLSSVEDIITAGSPMMREQIIALQKKIKSLRDIIQMYGSSEGGSICSSLSATCETPPGSSGTASPGFIIKVVDIDTREPLGPNQRGEVCYKSPSLMKGYIGPCETSYVDEDGFFKSGDVGYYDENRCFFVVDRIKELIKYNDISIAPAELESILLQHQAVREAGVVGVPHKTYGQAPLAFIVLQPSAVATEEEIITYLHDRITFRMRLAGGVRFVEELPRGAGGKLDRKALRRMVSEQKQ